MKKQIWTIILEIHTVSSIILEISQIPLFIHAVCHAEYDAILSTGTPPVKDCTLYVTKYPCNDCAKVIVQSGIKEVIYVPDNDTPRDDQQHHTLEELIEETDQKEQTKKKKHNMYLGSKRILTKCHLVPCQATEKIEVILHDPGNDYCMSYLITNIYLTIT